MKLDSTRLVPKSTGYSIASANGLKDATLISVGSDYRTNLSRKYITLPLRELALKFVNATNKVLVSTKYDGTGVFFYFDVTEEPKAFAYNAPSGRVMVGLPCFDAAVKQLVAAGHTRGLLVGELYVRADKRTSSGDVTMTEVIKISEAALENALSGRR